MRFLDLTQPTDAELDATEQEMHAAEIDSSVALALAVGKLTEAVDCLNMHLAETREAEIASRANLPGYHYSR